MDEDLQSQQCWVQASLPQDGAGTSGTGPSWESVGRCSTMDTLAAGTLTCRLSAFEGLPVEHRQRAPHLDDGQQRLLVLPQHAQSVL